MKTIIIKGASYCIQFQIGTKTVKVLKIDKISQASEKIILDLLEWRELESKRFREFRKEVAMSKSPSRKKTGFQMIQMKNTSKNLWIWDMDIVFACLQKKICKKFA